MTILALAWRGASVGRMAVIRSAPLLAAALSACAPVGGAPPPLPPLAENPERPELALLEHVLTGYFAAFGANPPTTCAARQPAPLTAEDEQALLGRFVRLAPLVRCRAGEAGYADAITGEPAGVVELREFACSAATHCAGSIASPGSPPRRYALRFESGAWRVIADPRALRE